MRVTGTQRKQALAAAQADYDATGQHHCPAFLLPLYTALQTCQQQQQQRGTAPLPLSVTDCFFTARLHPQHRLPALDGQTLPVSFYLSQPHTIELHTFTLTPLAAAHNESSVSFQALLPTLLPFSAASGVISLPLSPSLPAADALQLPLLAEALSTHIALLRVQTLQLLLQLQERIAALRQQREQQSLPHLLQQLKAWPPFESALAIALPPSASLLPAVSAKMRRASSSRQTKIEPQPLQASPSPSPPPQQQEAERQQDELIKLQDEKLQELQQRCRVFNATSQLHFSFFFEQSWLCVRTSSRGDTATAEAAASATAFASPHVQPAVLQPQSPAFAAPCASPSQLARLLARAQLSTQRLLSLDGGAEGERSSSADAAVPPSQPIADTAAATATGASNSATNSTTARSLAAAAGTSAAGTTSSAPSAVSASSSSSLLALPSAKRSASSDALSATYIAAGGQHDAAAAVAKRARTEAVAAAVAAISRPEAGLGAPEADATRAADELPARLQLFVPQRTAYAEREPPPTSAAAVGALRFALLATAAAAVKASAATAAASPHTCDTSNVACNDSAAPSSSALPTSAVLSLPAKSTSVSATTVAASSPIALALLRSASDSAAAAAAAAAATAAATARRGSAPNALATAPVSALATSSACDESTAAAGAFFRLARHVSRSATGSALLSSLALAHNDVPTKNTVALGVSSTSSTSSSAGSISCGSSGSASGSVLGPSSLSRSGSFTSLATVSPRGSLTGSLLPLLGSNSSSSSNSSSGSSSSSSNSHSNTASAASALASGGMTIHTSFSHGMTRSVLLASSLPPRGPRKLATSSSSSSNSSSSSPAAITLLARSLCASSSVLTTLGQIQRSTQHPPVSNAQLLQALASPIMQHHAATTLALASSSQQRLLTLQPKLPSRQNSSGAHPVDVASLPAQPPARDESVLAANGAANAAAAAAAAVPVAATASAFAPWFPPAARRR